MSLCLQTRANSPKPLVRSATPGMALQHQCACGGSAGLSGACAECGRKKLLQRHAATNAPVTVPPVVNQVLHQVLGSSGQPLDPGIRSFMEPRFGHDFSRVRIHADGSSAEAAAAVEAHAFTVGRDVVFASGRYAPNTRAGQRLLAHELAHVVQQGGGSISGSTALQLNPPGDRFEQEADRVADTVMALPTGPAPAIVGGDAARLSRKALGLQRAATWVDTKPREDLNLADRVVNNLSAGNTDFVLNGTPFVIGIKFADALAALHTPHIATSVRQDKRTECYFDSVPDNEGTYDMHVLASGEWSLVTTKAKLNALFGLPNCSGGGDGKLIINGMQTNEDQRTRTSTHEDQHRKDDKAIFEAVVGAWDTLIAEAKRLRRTEVADTDNECRQNLYDRHVSKQDPTFIVTKLIKDINATSAGFHNSAAGRNVRISNAQDKNNCAEVTAEAR
jgi:hypothetical protein